MAFNLTSQNPTPLEVVGSFVTAKWGISTLSGGTLVVTVPGVAVVQAVQATAQSANAVGVSATSGNTFTLTGTGSDAIMWIAICSGAC